jgi:hypothetical protein
MGQTTTGAHAGLTPWNTTHGLSLFALKNSAPVAFVKTSTFGPMPGRHGTQNMAFKEKRNASIAPCGYENPFAAKKSKALIAPTG